MSSKAASDLLYDSEATLRLVDTAIGELRGESAEEREARLRAAHGAAEQPAGLGALTRVLARAYGEVMAVLGSLRESRAMLEHAAVDRIRTTTDKLMEVSSATEVAATDILDGLERALGMVDSIDAADQKDPHTVGALRDELFRLMGCMQFQDITAQQLAYASSVLSDMEQRLTDIARLFDQNSLRFDTLVVPGGSTHFDPHASTLNAEARQAVADEIFGAGEGKKE